ncbi:hypothetical protein ASG90_11205 [Nocardioides sp. Soil797]|nr:hypothetical protein ASG90_11205 [Nocardioides sp. Soil797]
MSEEFEGAGTEPTDGAVEVAVADPADTTSEEFSAEASVETDDEAVDDTDGTVESESRGDADHLGGAEESPGGSTERTGNHAVDRVLDSLDELAGKPVDEHVAVFERAHEQLRGALDGPRLPRP